MALYQSGYLSLQKRDDIGITKPDKGSWVLVMDKLEYIRLLSAASVDNTSKFTDVAGECLTLLDNLQKKAKKESKETGVGVLLGVPISVCKLLFQLNCSSIQKLTIIT